MIIGAFKDSAYSWESRRPVHGSGCVHTLERIDKALSSYLWLTLRVCIRPRKNCKFPTRGLKAYLNIHTASQQRLRFKEPLSDH